jgi:uncharacterized protein
MRPFTRAPRENNASELRAFETTCARLGGFEPRIDFEWADGFLTSLAAAGRLPEPAEWLPALCDDAFERAFADPEDAQQALRALQVRLKVLADQLDAGQLLDDPQALRLAPLMSEWSAEERARLAADGLATDEELAVLHTGTVWAEGFACGMEAFPALWPPAPDEEQAEFFDVLLQQVDALLLPPDSDEYRAHLARYYPQGAPTRDELIAEACHAVQELRLFCMDHAPRPATRRVQAAPGRNDPCPCGSGRKFKKCHGAVAT